MTETQQSDGSVAQFYRHRDYDPTKSPHTKLDSVPERADIQYDGEAEPRTTVGGGVELGEHSAAENDALLDEMLKPSIGVTFIIERAMIDPDATVIPRVL